MNKLFAQDLPESVIKRLSIRVKQLGGINLGQGIPSFPTPGYIREAVLKALNERDIGVYPNFLGTLELREAICRRLNKDHSIALEPAEHILVTVGAMEATAAGILSLVSTGDRVGCVTPDYCNHFPQIMLARGLIVEMPLREGKKWELDLSRVESEAKNGLKLLVITNPNNPTGAVFDRTQLKQVISLAENYGFWVLADETYSFLDYGKKFSSLLEFWKMSGKLLIVRSFSKEYAMTGWRVGYVVARPEVIKSIAKTHDALVGCASKISQRAAVAAVNGPQSVVKGYADIIDKRRVLACTALRKLKDHLAFIEPDGAYYVFPTYKVKMSSFELSERILAQVQVAVVPGAVFGQAGEGHFRLSFAVDEKEFAKGVEKIGDFFHNTT